MTMRNAIASLALLSTAVVMAFSAAPASAAPTTAAECSNTATVKDFEDAHCDRSNAAGTFGHVALPVNTEIKVTTDNNLTEGAFRIWLLAGKIAGVPIHIECDEIAGKGAVTNNAGPPMSVTFANATLEASKCNVETPESAKKCGVAVSKVEAAISGPHNLGLGAEKEVPTGEEKIKVYEEGKGAEMGLKFVPRVAGGSFAMVTLTSCGALSGNYPVKGFAYAIGARGGAATSTGATAEFTRESTLGGLTLGGNPAFLTGDLTVRKEGGNPLSLTTTAN